MVLLRKLSLAVATTATLLGMGTICTAPAQASLFKFSFESDGANGYFIYDDSVPVLNDVTYAGGYDHAATEYYFDLGEKGVFQGTNGTPIVFLVRTGVDGITAPDADDFELEVRAADRQPSSDFTFVSYFSYPKGTFGESVALPTTVPDTATATIYPSVDFPATLGEAAFTGTVHTRIVPVPEPGSLLAVFGVGAWLLLLKRRQHKQALSVDFNH